MKKSILLAFFLFLSCHLSPQKSHGPLQMALTDEVSSLDPAISYNLNSGKIIYQIYEPLYEYHYLKRPYTLVPLLAQDFPTYKKEGKRLIIPLKRGIYYHPDPCFHGKEREVIAQDFINQIKRLAFAPLHSTGEWLIHNKIVGINDFKQKVGNNFNLLVFFYVLQHKF